MLNELSTKYISIKCNIKWQSLKLWNEKQLIKSPPRNKTKNSSEISSWNTFWECLKTPRKIHRDTLWEMLKGKPQESIRECLRTCFWWMRWVTPLVILLSFIHLFSIYLISKKINICKQYTWYNKSSSNLYNDLKQRQLQENKRTTGSPMFYEILKI